jgi:nitrite reductase/ring-hydroxylating ferredoxin subunit
MSDLPDNKRGMKITLDDDTEIAVFKIDGKVHAVENTCPHNHTHVLFEGLVDNDLFLTCPIHGWQFHLVTGMVPLHCKEISTKLKIYTTKIENGEVYIEKKKSMFRIFDF